MIDRFLYLLSEGIRSLWRAKTTAIATISAIGIAASFVVFSAIVGENLSGVIQIARGQYEFQVFFGQDVSDVRAAELVEEIADMEGISAASLITKAEAADIFQREFGENIYDLLQENPLPPASVVKLDEETEGQLDINPIVNRISSMPEVDEVRYQGRLISMIERYYQGFFAVVTALAVAILFGTVVLIANTIRLSIYARRDLIRTLKLVGATDRFVRFPFVVEGIMEGLLGSLVAAAVSYGFVEGSNYFLSLFTHYRLSWEPKVVLLLVGVIVLFSLLGSFRAVRKFLK